MLKWIMVMKIQPSICLDDRGKSRKNPSQVGRHRDLNQGPPQFESHVLPRSHLAWFLFLFLTLFFIFLCLLIVLFIPYFVFLSPAFLFFFSVSQFFKDFRFI